MEGTHLAKRVDPGLESRRFCPKGMRADVRPCMGVRMAGKGVWDPLLALEFVGEPLGPWLGEGIHPFRCSLKSSPPADVPHSGRVSVGSVLRLTCTGRWGHMMTEAGAWSLPMTRESQRPQGKAWILRESGSEKLALTLNQGWLPERGDAELSRRGGDDPLWGCEREGASRRSVHKDPRDWIGSGCG